MASRTGVDFHTGQQAIAGILDGVLTAQLRKRQIKLEDQQEARAERQLSLQERTSEEAQGRLRQESEFKLGAASRAEERAVVGQEQERIADPIIQGLQQDMDRLQDSLQRSGIATPEVNEATRKLQDDLIKIGARGEAQESLARVKSGLKEAQPAQSPIEQEMEAAKITGSFAKNIRSSGSVPGEPNLTPTELDLRFGEDFLNTAVAKAVTENIPGGVAAVVKDSMATHWATAVLDQAVEADYIQGIDPASVEEDDLDPISDSVRQKLASDTKTAVVTVNDVRSRFPDFINIPEAGTLDLEELAFVFVSNNASEKDFRDFIKDILLARVSPTKAQRGQDLERSLESGVRSPTTGGQGLGGLIR